MPDIEYGEEADTRRSRAAGAILAAAFALAFAAVSSALLAGSPGTLNLLGRSYPMELPFLFCLFVELAPPLVALPFYWAGFTPGQHLLSGTIALVALESFVWWTVRSSSWISAAFEPFASIAIAVMVCIVTIGAWRATLGDRS